ncbi:hypothetical protein AB1Y20_012691 [Prymnesium parvum]|uniref:MYND-type domain-containing protein n=1 Tax=Prymnesium parvum TaxID=97485 RepID=A0AB34IIL7_PRYPA
MQCYICDNAPANKNKKVFANFLIDRTNAKQFKVLDQYDITCVNVCSDGCQETARILNYEAFSYCNVAPVVPRMCFMCSGFPAVSACGRCGLAVYCGPDCQRAHWKSSHKYFCELLAAGKLPKVQFMEYDRARPAMFDTETFDDICALYEQAMRYCDHHNVPEPKLLYEKPDAAIEYLGDLISYRTGRRLGFDQKDGLLLYLTVACSELANRGALSEELERKFRVIESSIGKCMLQSGRPRTTPLGAPGRSAELFGLREDSPREVIMSCRKEFVKMMHDYLDVVEHVVRVPYVETLCVVVAHKVFADFFSARQETPPPFKLRILWVCSTIRNDIMRKCRGAANPDLLKILCLALPRLEESFAPGGFMITIPEECKELFKAEFFNISFDGDLVGRYDSATWKEKRGHGERCVTESAREKVRFLDYYVPPSEAEKEAQRRRKERADVERRLRRHSSKLAKSHHQSNTHVHSTKAAAPAKTDIEAAVWETKKQEYLEKRADEICQLRKRRQEALEKKRAQKLLHKQILDATEAYEVVHPPEHVCLAAFWKLEI